MIPDGFYDNRQTRRRERYQDGKLMTWVREEVVEAKCDCEDDVFPKSRTKRFGEFPDIQRQIINMQFGKEIRRMCLSCGAVEFNGKIPCGH